MARRRDDDEDLDERPRRRPADDEFEDTADRRRSRRDEDEEDDEDERPRKKSKKAGSGKGLLIGLVLGGVALAAVVVLAIMFLGGSGSPKKEFEKLAAAADKKDWGTVYDGVDKKSLDMVMPLLTMMSAFDPKFQGKSGKELFVAVLNESANKPGGGLTGDLPVSGKVTVLSEDVKGDRATLRVKDDKGKEESLVMVKEDGKWKLSFAEMIQKEMGKMPKMPDFKMPDFKMPDFKMPDFPKIK